MNYRAIIPLAIGSYLATQAVPAQAGGDAVRIGLLGDFSQVAADVGGKGALLAAEMAAEDHGGKAGGKPVKIVSADMQNKPEIAVQIARKWFEVDDVDTIVDLPSSAVALAVNELARDKKKILLITEATTTDLTGKACSPYTVHWADDVAALSAGTAKALVKAGKTNWYFISVDYTFGQALEKAASSVVVQNGGKVLGGVKHPMNTADFSSYLLQAQASKAQVVALATVGTDTTTAIKQAVEFGLPAGGQNVAGLLVYISDVHALGLAAAHGLVLTESYYWDDTDKGRAFAKRFFDKFGKMPTKAQAATYASITHYLKAVDAAGTDRSDEVMKQIKTLPGDMFGKPAQVRADGRVMYDLSLWEVKTPQESKSPWDYYKLVGRIPAEEAFKPLSPSECSFLAAK